MAIPETPSAATGYPAIVDLAYQHLRPGGPLITDNVLWSGRVIDAPTGVPETDAIRAFTAQALVPQGLHDGDQPQPGRRGRRGDG